MNAKCYCSYCLNQLSELAICCFSFPSKFGDHFLSVEFLPFSYSSSATDWGRLPGRNAQQDQEVEDAEETDACEEAEETPEVHRESKKNIFSEQTGSSPDNSCRLNKELNGSIFQPVPAVAAEKVHCVSSAVPQLCVHCAQYPLEGPLGDFFLLPDFIPEELSHLLINYFGFSSSLAGGGLIDEQFAGHTLKNKLKV